MKVLSINFLTCAVKACKSSSNSFPLHPKDAELAQEDIEVNPQFLVNVLPRLDWAALKTTSTEVSFTPFSLYLTFMGGKQKPNMSKMSEADHKFTVGFPCVASRAPLGRGPREQRDDAQGAALAARRDADDGGQVGLRELRARVPREGGHRELLTAEPSGLGTLGHWWCGSQAL